MKKLNNTMLLQTWHYLIHLHTSWWLFYGMVHVHLPMQSLPTVRRYASNTNTIAWEAEIVQWDIVCNIQCHFSSLHVTTLLFSMTARTTSKIAHRLVVGDNGLETVNTWQMSNRVCIGPPQNHIGAYASHWQVNLHGAK